MKIYNSIKGLLFFALIFIAQISFGQNPTVINDSLIVRQRLYAKEKLIVDKDALFKQALNVTGNSRLTGTLDVAGASKFSGTVTMDNLSGAGTLTPTSQVAIIQSNGSITKGTIGGILLALSAGPANLDFCGANGGIPQWWAGTNKLYTACNAVKVGIRNNDPQFALHVSGDTYAMRYLAGNSGASMGATMNVFAQNDTEDLLRLGIKIGASAEEVRFKVKNDGTVYAKELRIRLVSDFPDYVFEEGYMLMNISELSEYIEKNGHLPNMPTASDVKANGMALGELAVKLVEKVEELTLYTIQLNEENNKLKNELESQSQQIQELKKEVDYIKANLK